MTLWLPIAAESSFTLRTPIMKQLAWPQHARTSASLAVHDETRELVPREASLLVTRLMGCSRLSITVRPSVRP